MLLLLLYLTDWCSIQMTNNLTQMTQQYTLFSQNIFYFHNFNISYINSSIHSSIHSSIFTTHFFLHFGSWGRCGVWGLLEPLPAVKGWGQGDTLDTWPVHHRATYRQTIIHTRTHVQIIYTFQFISHAFCTVGGSWNTWEGDHADPQGTQGQFNAQPARCEAALWNCSVKSFFSILVQIFIGSLLPFIKK